MSKIFETVGYEFSELSDEAKNNVRYGDNYHYSDELEDTLEKFCKIFDIKVNDYEVDSYNNRFSFSLINDFDCIREQDNIAGIRLAKYIWNNYAEYILKGKFYSKHKMVNGKFDYISRHSKILLSFEECPLTGVCYDYDILQPIIDCLHYKTLYNSYEELISDCLDSFFKAWQKDIEYTQTDEYLTELCENNEWYFDENGKFIG